MQRKLIKQGGGGYTIYLPKKWADKKGLTSGDNIEIIETETSLIIDSSIKGKKQISIEITNENKEDIKNILTHVYRKGFDKIIIKETDNKILKEIKTITKDLLLGFEITDKSQFSCTLENISEPTEDKYDVILRRIFLIIRESLSLIIQDFEDNKFGNKQELEDLRKNQDKFVLFCRRLLMKEIYDKDLTLSWELLTFLMHIEHSLIYLYNYSLTNKIKTDNNFNDLIKFLQDYFELFYKAYYYKDLKFIHKINSLKNRYQFGDCLKLLEKSSGKNTVLYSYLREIFRLVQVGTSPVLSMVLKY